MAFVAACSQVRFIDPDADLKATLKINDAIRIVIDGDPRDYYHVRVGSRRGIDLIALSVSGITGVHRIPLDTAHIQDCSDFETCISLTLPPGVPFDADRMALEAPSIGHRHDAPMRVEQLDAHSMVGVAERQNMGVLVLIDDPIRTFFGENSVARVVENGEVVSSRPIVLFPRTFDAHVSPGPCGLPATGIDQPWRLLRENPFAIDATFNDGDHPETCISVRPTLPDGGSGVAAETIPARAVVTQFSHVYTPPIDLAPLVSIILFDLEIPNEERCNAAQALVQSSVRDAATEIAASETDAAEVLLLEPVQLATLDGVLCRQAPDRTFDPYVLARQIEARVAETFGDRRVRTVIIYATNLNLEMPDPMASAFQLLENELTADDLSRRGMLVAIGPERPTSAIGPERTSQWLASEEPAFRESIKGLLFSVWPFRTMLHNDQTVVPLAGAELRDAFESYRVCVASEQVLPVGTQRLGTTVFDVGPDGPAYQVRLSPQILIDSGSFTQQSVSVNWEACADLCDHAAPNGDPGIPWERSDACL